MNLDELMQKVQAFRDSDGWLRWLDTARKFRTYSLRNQMLIAYQRPEASWVCGFKSWQDLGRHVKKGEKAIWILAPILRKDPTTQEPCICGFKCVPVFDISQTEGEDVTLGLPPIDFENENLLTYMVSAIEHDGIAVEFNSALPPMIGGYWKPGEKKIVIRSTQPYPEQCYTLLHELGHSQDTPTVSSLFEEDRASCELVAESIAYLVGTERFEMPVEAPAVHYLASWDKDHDKFLSLATRVLKGANDVHSLFDRFDRLSDLPVPAGPGDGADQRGLLRD